MNKPSESDEVLLHAIREQLANPEVRAEVQRNLEEATYQALSEGRWPEDPGKRGPKVTEL